MDDMSIEAVNADAFAAAGGDDDDDEAASVDEETGAGAGRAWVFGPRSTVRSTAREHRESSALTPGQISDMEWELQQIHYLSFRIISTISVLATIGTAIVSLKRRMVSSVGTARDTFRAILDRYSGLYRGTLLIISWMHCYAQMWIMDVRDACFFLRPAESNKYPPVHRTLDDISRSECRNMTGFSKQQVASLQRHWRLPDRFSHRRQHFTAQECLLVFLYHIRHTCTYVDMAGSGVFGGDPREFSPMMKAVTIHLYNTFYHKISGDSMAYWINEENLRKYRRGIYDKFVNSGIEEDVLVDGRIVQQNVFTFENTPFDVWRPFCFVDDLGIMTCNVGEEPMRNNDWAYCDIQRSFYR